MTSFGAKLALCVTLGVPLYALLRQTIRRSRRLRVLPRAKERVLVLGASSGIGRSVAEQYAAQGARVCVVGRRENEIQAVENACLELRTKHHADNSARPAIGLVADFSNPEDMVRVRQELENAWQGVDTVIVCAGASALRPVMEIAREKSSGKGYPATDDVQRTVDVAIAAERANYVGPLVSAVTFIPLLQSTSVSPSILLVSSLGAIVPAPTRAIYGSTKSAGLLLYQALAIENPTIKFSFMIPATVEGNFRASAVDAGTVREADPNQFGLKREDVAQRCIQAVDFEEKAIFMPGWGKIAHLLYWLWPSAIERIAMRKYNFTHQ